MAEDWIPKAWGRTRPLVLEDSLHVFECEAVAGGYCSVHCHANKSNTFFLLSGEIEVSVFTMASDGPKIVFRSALERENETACVPAVIFHRFLALSPSRFLEVYRPRVDVISGGVAADIGPLSVDDIRRVTLGGVKP